MRSAMGALACLSLLVGACGQTTDETPATEGTLRETTTSMTEIQPDQTSTSLPSRTSTTIVLSPRWTVDDHGTNPSILMGERGELGSGCSPGTDLLPDGIWFGWIEDLGLEAVSFDLACLWPGRIEPVASNDANRVRVLPLHPQSIWYSEDGKREMSPAVNAPGLPGTFPFWIFINDGVVTEVSEYPDEVAWVRTETDWPNLVPGCCDGGDIAPPSPGAPLPATGWPLDGFYKAWSGVDDETWTSINGAYQTRVWKWLSCKDNSELCPEWWVGDEVTYDSEGESLLVSLPLDSGLTVVILPIFTDLAIVGDGGAFRELLTDLNRSVDEWIDVPGDNAYGEQLRGLMDDPDFPFGLMPWPDGDDRFDGPMGYRGPGGALLTFDYAWLALEFRDGKPILYVHAGLVAG